MDAYLQQCGHFWHVNATPNKPYCFCNKVIERINEDEKTCSSCQKLCEGKIDRKQWNETIQACKKFAGSLQNEEDKSEGPAT